MYEFIGIHKEAFCNGCKSWYKFEYHRLLLHDFGYCSLIPILDVKDQHNRKRCICESIRSLTIYASSDQELSFPGSNWPSASSSSYHVVLSSKDEQLVHIVDNLFEVAFFFDILASQSKKCHCLNTTSNAFKFLNYKEPKLSKYQPSHDKRACSFSQCANAFFLRLLTFSSFSKESLTQLTFPINGWTIQHVVNYASQW